MKKQPGYLFKRGDTFYLRFEINGKRKTVSLKVTTVREAEKRRDELLTPAITAKTAEDILTHVAKARGIANVSTLMLSKSWDAYVESPIRPDSGVSTLQAYKGYWTHFIKWIADNHANATRFADITKDMVEDYFKSVTDCSLTGCAFNAKLQAIRLVHRILSKRECVGKGVMDDIQKKSHNAVSRLELTSDQLIILLAVFDDAGMSMPHKDEMRVLFHLGAFTGVRLADAVNLKWRNVDIGKGTILVKTRKTGQDVILPIHPLLAMRLRGADAWRDNTGNVLPNLVRRYSQTRRGVTQECQKVFTMIGLDVTGERIEGRSRRPAQYGFHSLRHTFVSICASQGVPMAAVQAIVGHANPAMTRHYTHLGVESLRSAVNCIPTSATAIPLLPTSSVSSAETKLRLIGEALADVGGDKTAEDLRARLLAILSDA